MRHAMFVSITLPTCFAIPVGALQPLVGNRLLCRLWQVQLVVFRWMTRFLLAKSHIAGDVLIECVEMDCFLDHCAHLTHVAVLWSIVSLVAVAVAYLAQRASVPHELEKVILCERPSLMSGSADVAQQELVVC